MTEENLISAVCCRIQCDIDKIESNSLEKIEVESFNLSDFWTQFGASVQSLSNEVTKLGFMCGKKPFPNFTEVSSMLQDMMQYYNIMRDLYLVLPEEVGAVVYKGVRSAMLNILAAVLNIVRSLEDLSEKGAKERLTLTGTFWDACNAVESLPQDNLHATLKIIDEECSLAVDAQEELTTVNDSDHEIANSAENCEAELGLKKTIEEKNENSKSSCSKQINVDLLDFKIEQDTSETLPISTNVVENQKSSLIKSTITEMHYNKLKKWVCTQHAWNKNPSLSTIEVEINGIKDLLQRLKSNFNDPIFKELTKTQKEDKERQLKIKLEEFLAMKQIVDSDPEVLEKMTRDSVLSYSNSCKTTEKKESKIPTQTKDKNESKILTQTKDKKESKIPTQHKSTVSVYNKSDLALLPNEIIKELQTSTFIDKISVADYMEVKKWIDQQTANKKPANSDTLQEEIADVISRFQTLISSGDGASKKNRSVKRAKLIRKLKRLLIIKQIFDSYPSQFISPITNGPISYGSPQPVGNQILQSIKKAFLARNQADNSHFIENTSIFMQKITNNQSIPDESLKISYNIDYSCSSKDTFDSGKNMNNTNKRKLNFESRPLQDEMPPQKQPIREKNCENSSYHSVSVKSFLLSERTEAYSTLPSYDYEFQRRTYQNSIDSVRQLPPVSSLYDVNEKLEEIHMVLPSPEDYRSDEFIRHYSRIQASDALINIKKQNYGLQTERWKVYREWRDELKSYNLLLGVDEKSLKILEAQGYKAHFNSFYVYFKKIPSERKPVNDLPTSISNQYSNQVLSFDYKHGRE